MRTAQIVNVPAPENLPFINQRFLDSAKKIEDDRQAMDADVWPGMVGEDLISTVKALSPATYKALFEVLNPTVYEKLILTHEDLEDVAVEKSASLRHLYLEDGDFEYFSHEQLKIWLLYSAKHPKDIDWRKVAHLYNESSDDQCIALDKFFWEFRRLDIASLMSLKGQDLPVPESLCSNKSRTIDGQDQLFCDMTNEWLRDDLFHSRFCITFTEGFHAVTAGYAGNLHLAIAKAIVLVQLRDTKISLQGEGLNALIDRNAKFPVNAGVKITYEGKLALRGEISSNIEILQDSSAIQLNKLAWGERQSGPFSEQYLRRALWSTEKLFGLQWSKVRHLESDLGM